MFNFIGGGSGVQWYADIEWSGSQDVIALQNLDFRDIPGWSIDHIINAPVASNGSQVAASAGLYIIEVFASYEAVITSPFTVQLLGAAGSLSRTAINAGGTSPSGDLSSGLFTQFLNAPVFLSLGIRVAGGNTVNINDLELRISKLV